MVTSRQSKAIAGRLAGLGFAAACILAGAANAGDRTTAGVRYDVSFKGVTIAKGSLSLILDGSAYSAKAAMQPTGFASLLTASTVDAEAEGRYGPGAIAPARYRLNSVDPGMTTKVAMRMARGDVSKVAAEPPLTPAPDRVPVTGAHRKGVLDPISASIVPIALDGETLDAKTACSRVVPVFDGWTRYDVSFSSKGTERLKTPSYSGTAFVCSARWSPIAGHRANSDSVEYLVNNRGLEAAFIAVGEKMLVPVRVEIETPHGVLAVQATDVKLQGVQLADASR
ncbi:DUF3108 domain-containing protein [Amorphus coralli]|uniref:DUF3108 domain-containing protein n=1 Tax=Amorphus coralli TaxID=340680 RepID=UPI0003778521|nr:DUF3108 domain-containing protein [Amorphus coralli]